MADVDEIQKLDNRIMGEYSISKSFKGILRIAHILEMVNNEEDKLFNSTYYGIPKSLMNISGGAYEAEEIGYNTPIDGMTGSIARYTSANTKVGEDELLNYRVPMTDSMGNFLNWNIGLDGVTIGSNEDINSTAINIEPFKQNDYYPLYNTSNHNFIWQEKYFPILEANEIVIGLQNKEYPSNKKKVNQDTGLYIQSKNKVAKLIITNKLDKSNPVKETISDGQTTRSFITYEAHKPKEGEKENSYIFRTIYSDNKTNVDDFDVFMYRQDDYDVHNYTYGVSKDQLQNDDIHIRENGETALKNYTIEHEDGSMSLNISNDGNSYEPVKKTIDANVGIVNLKEYVFDVIQKYMNNSLVEVPTGTIINQFCSLAKWYAYPEYGNVDDLVVEGGAYAGHRPAMMSKREAQMVEDSTITSDNKFVQSTLLGATRNVNKLINTNYNFNNKETSEEKDTLNYTSSGFFKEIIPLYKRDYVLCDGSMYSIFLYPKNFKSDKYPNRRDTLDRFLNLFFSIGYQYTQKDEYVNRRFKYIFHDTTGAYRVVNENNEIITEETCLNLYDEQGKPSVGMPIFEKIANLSEDRHSIFVEDFLTILAFEKLYDKFSQAAQAGIEWNYNGICKWLKKEPLPAQYALQSFLGDSYKTANSYTNLLDTDENGNRPDVKVMEIPYYNFFDELQNENPDANIDNLPKIRLGREIKTFGDPVKFYSTAYDVENKKYENKYVIIPAYRLPQIQYLITLMISYPTLDSLATILNNFFQYNFQVPYLTQKSPTFIGSSGIVWADSQYNRLRTPETWTSDYSQNEYMHRHFLFVEPNQVKTEQAYMKMNPSKRLSPPTEYALSGTLTEETTVAVAACRGGRVFCEASPPLSITCKFGKDDNPNYIWNELGAGSDKQNNLVIRNTLNDRTVTNGMRYPILQMAAKEVTTSVSSKKTNTEYLAWNTGAENRPKSEKKYNDFYQYGKQTDSYSTSDLISLTTNDIVGNASALIATANQFNNNPYGWEHYEDPRFETGEPNRGRTSAPVMRERTECISSIRYDLNKENFSHSGNDKLAEWFSPENIKMLPLIKL